MANNLVSNPCYIDDVGADITVASGGVEVSLITVTEQGTAARKVVFIDNNGEVVCVINVAQGTTEPWRPAAPFYFQNGLIYDESASTVVDNDVILVFKK